MKKSAFKKAIILIRKKSYDDGRNKSNNVVKKWVSLKNVDKLLDTGCSDGAFTLEFARIVNAKKIYGVEFINEKVEEAKSRGIKCEKFDLNKPWPYENDFFDVILSSQIIEHLHNTRRYCEECNRCLKKNGQLIIATENLSSWINIGALLFGWMPFSMAEFEGWVGVGNPFKFDPVNADYKMRDIVRKEYRSSGVPGIAGHVRVLSIEGLRNCLERTGFRNVKVATTGYLPFWGHLSDFLCSIDKRHGHFLIGTGYK